VVGQGVYEDVSLDATFSPKEVVIDRITGSTGPGTFAAVLVASRKAAPEAASGESIQFTGEVHLGDGESVRDRKLPNGKPLVAGPVPVRQAGEQRADVSGELDKWTRSRRRSPRRPSACTRTSIWCTSTSGRRTSSFPSRAR
jgi:hypothetical protein